MNDLTPNQNLRSLLEGARIDGKLAASIAGVNPSTVRAWLEDRSALRPEKRSHRSFVDSLCASLNLPVAAVWGVELEPLPPASDLPGNVPPGLHLLEILLDAIEDPMASRQRKDAARSVIHGWVKEALR